MPISPGDIKQLEEILRVNNLPRMNLMMFGSFKLLAQREKQKKEDGRFDEHNIQEVFSAVSKGAGQKYQVQAQNLKQYFDNMAIEKIITPVKEITEFVEDDLIGTDPKYLGDIYNAIQRTDFEHKKVTNAKIDAKKNYIVIFALIGIVAALGIMGFMLVSNGGLNGILPQLPGLPNPATSSNPGAAPPPNQKMTDAQVFAKYSSPDALYKAIQNGDVQMNQLSPKVQAMVKSYKPPPVPTP